MREPQGRAVKRMPAAHRGPAPREMSDRLRQFPLSRVERSVTLAGSNLTADTCKVRFKFPHNASRIERHRGQ